MRLRVSGRIDDRGGRPVKADGIAASTPHASVVVDLRAIPTHAPWPENAVYPNVDTVFFIPPEAVVCRLNTCCDRVQCVGYYDCEREALRLDAVDQERHYWFWLAVEVAA